MKSMRKSPVSAAVAAALMGLVGAVSTVDAATPSTTGTGQALIFPYYTVNGGWITTLNVMNTSDKTVAVKVRFHEKKNSRDVLDFNIVMSPFDAWTGWVQDSSTGPRIYTNDKSCTSPLVVNGVPASGFAYVGAFDDTGGSGSQRMRDGYVEMLVMGVSDLDPNAGDPEATDNTVPYNAKHVDGVPRDCPAVDKAFIATAAKWVAETDPRSYAGGGSGAPPAANDFRALAPTENPLKGNISWLQIGTGAGAGSTAIAVQDYARQNFVTAQQFPWFLEPTFASSGGLWTISGVTEFESAVTHYATLNEWADNGATGAVTDWAITFPTKAYHVDAFNEQIQAASSKYRNALNDVVSCDSDDAADRTTCTPLDVPVTVAPFEHLFGVQGNGDSTVTVQYDLFDREEGTVVFEQDGTAPSPAPPPEVRIDSLRYEANVLQFAGSSVLASTSPTIIGASAALNGAPNGWAKVTFTGSKGGLPVTAFAVKARTQGEASSNYGQAMDNAYEDVD